MLLVVEDNTTDIERKDGNNGEEKNEEKQSKSMDESTEEESLQNNQEGTPEQSFYHSLNSVLEKASPEDLSRLSNEEIFLAHNSLTELMSRVVTALQERLQTPLEK